MSTYKRHLRAWLDTLEPRLLLAADSLAVWSQPAIGQPVQLASESISLRQIHEATGVAYAHREGLQGSGQTVVIIDSGIAYDHVALGGGLGPAYRVVGGWDFTEEQDGDPYDDGPAGFHGTHVAGIVGSADSEHLGVAPEVDLVALRVFNDQGRGKLSWLESSLRWVAENLDRYENPITTVNLSIGTDWNALTLPDYAKLEDELQVLHDAGVFVAVAAGNRFDSDVEGLSYPAVSPHVVPAASWDLSDFSGFSQRHHTTFVLPGEDITSTVPDFLEDFNGIADDFYSASGTSMASPYLAGASVLVREAMQRVQAGEVSVAAIKDVLETTAEELFDPVTGQTYLAIDVEAAVKRVLGDDSSAFVQLQGDALHVQGTNGVDTIQLDDTGRITVNDRQFEFNPNAIGRLVVEGDGRDQLQIFSSMDRTRVRLVSRAITASADGLRMTATGFNEIQVFATGRGTTAELLANGGVDQFVAKPTHSWMTGDGYLNYVRGATRVTATANDASDTALFYDSAGDDVVIASPHSAVLTGPRHEAQARGFSSVGVRAHAGGFDRAVIHGTPADDVARATPAYSSLKSQDYFVYAEGVNHVTIVGQGGFDSARFYDSQGNDHVVLGVQQQSMTTRSTQTTLLGFESVHAFASRGHDTAEIVGTVADENFTAKPTHSWMLSGDTLNYARGFEAVAMTAGGGNDFARLYGSDDKDYFVMAPRSASVTGGSFQYDVSGMTRMHGVSGDGLDTAELMDGAGHDELFATDKGVGLRGLDFTNTLEGFAYVHAQSTHGRDRLVLAGVLASIARDQEDAWVIDGHDYDVIARGFYPMASS